MEDMMIDDMRDFDEMEQTQNRITEKDRYSAEIVKTFRDDFDRAGNIMTPVQLYHLCEKLLVACENFADIAQDKNEFAIRLIRRLKACEGSQKAVDTTPLGN